MSTALQVNKTQSYNWKVVWDACAEKIAAVRSEADDVTAAAEDLDRTLPIRYRFGSKFVNRSHGRDWRTGIGPRYMTSDPKVCSHNSNSFFKRRRLKFSNPSDCAECYRNQLFQGLIEEIKHRPWIVRTLRASCIFSVPHAYSPPTIDAFGWGTLNCMWEGEIILISCRPYWLLVEVRLQFCVQVDCECSSY